MRAVPSERYPLNKKCAHPECSEAAVDPHHAFPRSAIGGDSWFVEIITEFATNAERTTFDEKREIIPHVTGLCRAHHDAVEGNLEAGHSSWIKYEDGVWNWYNLIDTPAEESARWAEETGEHPDSYPVDSWELLGPLNPQPGSVEGKPKRRKYQGEQRKQRKTVTLRVPDTAGENGAALLDEAVETLETRISGDSPRPIYFTVMDALNFTLLNAGADDFGGDE